MPTVRIRMLSQWRVVSTALIHIALVPWILWHCLSNRRNPIVLVYVNARTVSGIDPWQSKSQFQQALTNANSRLGALYPRNTLISPDLSFDERVGVAAKFVHEQSLKYPLIGKPDKGSRSLGAYRIEDESGLRYLLERMETDYLIEEYCPGLDVGLYFVRSPDAEHPSQYGVAIKTHSYIAAPAPHPALVPLLTHFLIQDLTDQFTPELETIMSEIADSVPFDMGRIDVRADSIETLFSKPETVHILEINTGFDAVDLHATDLQHSFVRRFQMTKDKWLYALSLGSEYYESARIKMSLIQFMRSYYRYGQFLDSIHRTMYTPAQLSS